MKILTFDVETTGLPDGRPTLKETYRWPFIVQFSWMVYDASKPRSYCTMRAHLKLVFT